MKWPKGFKKLSDFDSGPLDDEAEVIRKTEAMLFFLKKNRAELRTRGVPVGELLADTEGKLVSLRKAIVADEAAEENMLQKQADLADQERKMAVHIFQCARHLAEVRKGSKGPLTPKQENDLDAMLAQIEAAKPKLRLHLTAEEILELEDGGFF